MNVVHLRAAPAGGPVIDAQAWLEAKARMEEAAAATMRRADLCLEYAENRTPYVSLEAWGVPPRVTSRVGQFTWDREARMWVFFWLDTEHAPLHSAPSLERLMDRVTFTIMDTSRTTNPATIRGTGG